MNAPVPGFRAPLVAPRAPDIAPPDTPGDLVDFARILSTLQRGWLVLLASGLLLAALTAAWSLLVAVPQFRATVVLVMAPQEMAAPAGLDSVMPGLGGDSVAANTEVEILKSRALLRRLTEEMDLTRDAEFNPALSGAPGVADRMRRGAERLGLARPAAGAMPALPATLDSLERKVTVRHIPDSRVFEITVESRDSAKAAALANALARLYLGDQIALKQQDAARATDWLAARVAELQLELEAADSRARGFAADMELADVTTLRALAGELSGIRGRITARRSELAARGISDARADAQLGPLREMEAELARELSRQSQDLVRLSQLQLEAETSRVIYEHFLSRLKEAAVQRGIQTADSRILTPAEIPMVPAHPQPLLSSALAGFLGALGAGAALLARESRATGFRTAAALEAASGRRVLGQIPAVPGRKGLVRHVAGRPGSFPAEAVRQLRTALQLSGPAPPGVVMVTSSIPGEGKSSLARALAHSIAAQGRRVLLIEADIRRRPLRRLFRPAPVAGLLSVLEGRTRLRDAVRRDAVLGIDVLPGESGRADAADLMSSGRIETLIAATRTAYDCILIDTPPVLAVPDARLLGRLADAILYVVAWDRTTRAQLDEGLHALETVQLGVHGLVLSRIDRHGMRRYGHGDTVGALRRSGYFVDG